jgi:hypothetical protein
MGRVNSLWPEDLTASSDTMPEDILRTQAFDLAEKTGGLLRADVEPGSHGEWITLDFFVIAPRLDDFAYRLFKVRHKIPNCFDPLEIILGSKNVHRVKSRSDFERELATILGSSSTRTLVGELLALSRNAPPEPAD